MRALVTGAGGFVGSAVVRALLDAGHEVHALVRAGSDQRNLDGLAVRRCAGDLLDEASLRQALQGCDALFHVAADYRLWVPDAAVMYRTNVDATVALMRLAMAAGIGRVVYTSSVATLGLHADGSPADEETPVALVDMVGPYKRSKFIAEQKVREMVADEGLPAVIVNPSAPLGPRDRKPTPTGQMLVDAAAGRMPVYVDTGLNVVHVDDVAQGHLLAWQHGEAGRRYILGERDMTLHEILLEVAALTHGRRPWFALPHGLLLPLAWAAEGLARVSGGSTRITVDGIRLARKRMFFSARRAREELGYRPRPAGEAIRDAVTWFAAAGYR